MITPFAVPVVSGRLGTTLPGPLLSGKAGRMLVAVLSACGRMMPLSAAASRACVNKCEKGAPGCRLKDGNAVAATRELRVAMPFDWLLLRMPEVENTLDASPKSCEEEGAAGLEDEKEGCSETNTRTPPEQEKQSMLKHAQTRLWHTDCAASEDR